MNTPSEPKQFQPIFVKEKPRRSKELQGFWGDASLTGVS